MRVSRLAIAVAAVVPCAADAQTSLNFWTQCATGSLMACTSVQVEVLYPSATATVLRMRLSNRQGIAEGTTHHAGLRMLEFRGLSAIVSDMNNYGFAMPVAAEGKATLGGELDNAFLLYAGPSLATARFMYDVDSYLWGCDVPLNASQYYGYARTCGGNVVYDLYFYGNVALTPSTSVALSWNMRAQGSDWYDENSYLGHAGCESGVDCVTVTPEPATIALMATGLAGLAAANRARRKRGAGV